MPQFSLNNRFVLEVYKTDKSLKAKVSNGFASLVQKTGLVGLTLLVEAKLPDGRIVPKGYKAYIRENVLHTNAWGTTALECDGIPIPFILVEGTYIDFVSGPEET